MSEKEDLDREIWKAIVGFENFYNISSFGRVKSLRNDIIMKQRNRNGYKSVKLSLNGEYFHKNVHRLVAEAFILNPENKPYVNHEDGNKHNNHIDNLTWVTASENTVHAHINNLVNIQKAENVYNSILKNKEVVYIYENKDNLTMKELSEKFGIDKRHIFSIWRNKCWKSVTKNLTSNIVLKNGFNYEQVFYVFENPNNLLSWELAEILECSTSTINNIQSGRTYTSFTEKLKLNRQTGDSSKSFYKYFYKNKVYYVSSIQRFYKNITHGKLGRTSLDELANKKEKNIKGWTCEKITKSEYIEHLKKQYDEYIDGIKNESNFRKSGD